jgi:hypothetical protein
MLDIITANKNKKQPKVTINIFIKLINSLNDLELNTN